MKEFDPNSDLRGELELQAIAMDLLRPGSGHGTPPVVRWKCLLYRGKISTAALLPVPSRQNVP